MTTTTIHVNPGDQITIIADQPVVPPPTTGLPAQVPSGPLTFTADNQVIENVVIDQWPTGTASITGQTGASPTSSIYGKGHTGCVLRNVTLRGRQWGALLIDMTGLVLEDVTVLDVNYCGIGIFGGSNGRITRPTIKRVGMLRTNGLPSIGDVGNAYGIKFETASQAGGTSRDPDTWLVDAPVVEDVRLWQGINAHQAKHLTVRNGTIRRCPRALFFAGTISDLTITGNTLLEPITQAGGTTDETAISYGSVQGGTITGNTISSAFPNKVSNIDQYLTTLSSGVVVGSNPVV